MIRALAGLLAFSLAAAPAARADDLADAKAAFRRGVELYRERRWQEAMEEFQAAYRAKPHGALHFNVAQCRERLDDWPGAIRSYHDYLRELPGAPDRAAVEAAVGRLEERLARSGVQVLLVDSSPPGARVAIEGRERGTTPLHVVLQPGKYAVTLALEGRAPWSQTVEVGATASVALDVALKPAAAGTPARPAVAAGSSARPTPGPSPAAAPRPADLAARPAALPAPAAPPLAAPGPRRPLRLPAWIAAGTAVAAAAVAVGLAASARADARAIDALPAPDGAAASSHARSAASKQRAANVLYGVAGGAAAASATLFVLECKR